MKIIVVIQARMGSSRLPGKILMPMGNTDNLTYVVERCKKIKGINEVIVATSSLSQDDIVERWCESNQVKFYRGSEEDVLTRFIEAAKPYNPDYVIRVTADCPFVDYKMASDMVALIKEKKVDIIDLEGQLPRGLAVEIISYKALQYINYNGLEKRHREHVTYYAYEFKTEFTRTSYTVNSTNKAAALRITLDTEEDYKLLTQIANYFDNIFVSSKDIVEYLLQNPKIAKINEHIKQKPVV